MWKRFCRAGFISLIWHMSVQGIDYAAIHLWPDNWKRVDLDFGKVWLSNHSANGQLLQKPVVLEEFGKVPLSITPSEIVIEHLRLCIGLHSA